MRFISIYKKTKEIGFNCLSKVTLDEVVYQHLSEEQYDDLVDYFEDIVMVSNYTTIGKVSTFELLNKNEVLQDCPLPDGTVVADSEFEEGGAYVIALGSIPNTGVADIKIGVKV